MDQQLAVGVAPGKEWRTTKIQTVAQQAEAPGTEATLAGEGAPKATSTCQAGYGGAPAKSGHPGPVSGS